MERKGTHHKIQGPIQHPSNNPSQDLEREK